MLKLVKITGGALAAKVNHNLFVMVLIAAQSSRHFNIPQLKARLFGSVPVSNRETNRYVMVVIRNSSF